MLFCCAAVQRGEKLYGFSPSYSHYYTFLKAFLIPKDSVFYASTVNSTVTLSVPGAETVSNACPARPSVRT